MHYCERKSNMIGKNKKFLDWVIYQIYPRSFYDSNGDGIGDLGGVCAKLDYLKELGVNAIWLCPCYKSPNKDHGYDVADYRNIMDEFGTMDDMKRLISEMKKRDMKLIMDLVPNHTSDKHKWFLESRKSKDNPYSDYYYWADEPLNDWKACFGGSAWEYDESRKQYYLHSYAPEQPDLNWNNPAVVKEMQDVIDFWVDMGVDGFRCDVIDQISKDFDNNKNCFGPRLHEFINAMFGREKTKHLFTIGECWANTIEEICRHTSEERGELSTLFQFEHLDRCGRDGKYVQIPAELKVAKNIMIKWQILNQDNNLLHTLFTDNHDNNYFISRAGNDKELRYESATCIATMFYLMNGVPLIYQGQEIGSCAPHYDKIEDFEDVEGINAYNEFLEQGMSKEDAISAINFGSRDNTRRPIAWSNGQGYGFTKAEKPWIPYATRSNEINLENDLKSEKSVFKFYKDLLKLRRENEALRYGEFIPQNDENDDFIIYTREYEGKRFTVICNFEKTSHISSSNGKLVLKNYKDRENNSEAYRPYEIAVYEM